jgi:hypothetical protein
MASKSRSSIPSEDPNSHFSTGTNAMTQDRWIAFGAAALGLILLYVASIRSDEPISISAFSGISALLFLPTVLAIGYSLVISKLIDDGEKGIAQIRKAVSSMVSQFKSETLPEYQKIMKAKSSDVA